MELTDVQKQAVGRWVGEGCGLSEIQERLSRELGVSMTYMDVRFLILDLGLEVKDKAPAVQDVAAESGQDPAAPVTGAVGEGVAGEGVSGPPGGVNVELDRVTKPGAIVSGTVMFSDGVKASWGLDQLGRLALDAGQPGYRPSEQDLSAFQLQLRQALQKRGF
jgi:hypothetical protein